MSRIQSPNKLIEKEYEKLNDYSDREYEIEEELHDIEMGR